MLKCDSINKHGETMKKLYFLFLLLSFLIVENSLANENMQKYSIKKALADTRANGNVDRNIRLSFGDRGHSGKVWTSIKRTFAMNKSSEEACNRAFLSAVIALQGRAKKESRRSVVDIYSYHKKRKYSSTKQFDCEVGSMMCGVTLRGRVR